MRNSLGRYVYRELKAMALSSVRRRVTTVGGWGSGGLTGAWGVDEQGEMRTPLKQNFKKKKLP